MSLGRLLETFDPAISRVGKGSATLDESAVEAIRSRAFEAGYASGWEDAGKAESSARQRIEAEFERNIQNMAFTYHEAVDRVRSELGDFVSALIDGFFPSLVPQLLLEHVRTELTRIADQFVEVPIELVCSSDTQALIGELLEHSEFALEIELVEDQSLAERQVFVRVAEREIEVDLKPLLNTLRQQFQALRSDDHSEKEIRHG